MSILETPRVYFSGQISWDPIVTNNYPKLYDEDSSWTVFQPNETVEQFRQNAISAQSINGGVWNPIGTHRSSFFDTEISGVDNSSGTQTNDTFVTSPASFTGMLVDCEPYGAYSSQLFFDVMSLGIDGGCQILLPRTSRFTARYINFFRLPGSVYGYAASVASVVWQASFLKEDGLQINAYDSDVLKSLHSKVFEENNDVIGLTVRFNAYSTRYYGAEDPSEIPDLQQAFIDNLAGGGFQPNPARSQIVGTVGLWRKGEPAHEQGDRAMLAQKSQPPKFVGTAPARVNGNNLVIDMSNSISEVDLQYTKENLGTLAFYASASGGGSTQLGTIDYSKYDRAAYLASSGIVTIPLNSTQAQAANSGSLSLRGQDGTVYLGEQALRAIPDEPNLYIDFAETKQTQVRVLNKGVPAGAGMTVAMQVTGASVPQSTMATTDANGIATFKITGVKGQVEGYVFTVNPTSLPAVSINPQTTTYIYIRTYPGNDAIAELDPTWENVYKFCLANWNAMAPCMDNWLDLKDPVQVKAYGHIIKRLTDPANFESYMFMPVTRDMTNVERKLLYGFLDGETLVAAPTPVDESIVHEEKPVNNDDLSRRMRQVK